MTKKSFKWVMFVKRNDLMGCEAQLDHSSLLSPFPVSWPRVPTNLFRKKQFIYNLFQFTPGFYCIIKIYSINPNQSFTKVTSLLIGFDGHLMDGFDSDLSFVLEILSILINETQTKLCWVVITFIHHHLVPSIGLELQHLLFCHCFENC